MFLKWSVSGSQVVVQGRSPSRPSPISHLAVSAAMSRLTCSFSHPSSQAWKRWCSLVLTCSCDWQNKKHTTHKTNVMKRFEYEGRHLYLSLVATSREGLSGCRFEINPKICKRAHNSLSASRVVPHSVQKASEIYFTWQKSSNVTTAWFSVRHAVTRLYTLLFL